MTDIIHFETLYNQAEEVSAQKYKDKSSEEIKKQISELLGSYVESETVGSEEITNSLKNRYLGEIMFLITYLSHKDKINIYSSLKEQIIINKI